MLSIVVYGRNDTHGYNLPRRAALSLNCLAAVLDDPDDEIVFVDYNTPDELPTFPEAIADTLTDAALRHLRVLRVRPHHHAGDGRAVAEPVARNAGIRRSNPANPWVLSTNTDMILLPRAEGVRSRVWLDGLEPRLHHLPRFELPQGVWERLDRGRPAEALEFLHRWGGRMGLHTALRMHDFLLYDAPGDFQLFPRADIHDLCGFDEEMRIGWHVDSNLAKRFSLLRGPPRSCLDRLFGYHCEHTRLADPLHGHDHAEDDWRRFVDDVREPVLARQADSWGLAGTELEEIRLPNGMAEGFAGFVAALNNAPPDLREDDSLFRFDARAYDPRTVAPFLADLLASMDRGLSVGYAGIAPDTHALFRRLWSALGFTGAVAVHPLCHSLPDAGAGDFLASSLFVVEVGALPDPQQDETALADLHDAVQTIVAAEAERAGRGLAPRRLIILNGHRNRLSSFLDAAVTASRSPSVTRLKHGFVMGADGTEALSPWFVIRHLGSAGARRQGVPVTEAVRLLTNLHELATGEMAGERAETILHGAASLVALCRTGPVRERYGAAVADRVLRWVEDNRASSRLAPCLALPVVDQPARRNGQAPCRLATTEDWEDPTFIAVIRSALAGRFAENQLKRCRITWKVAHTVAQLDAYGLLTAGARVLVVTTDGNDLPAVLSRHVGQVDVLSSDGAWAPGGGIIRRPERIRVAASADDPSLRSPYDAVCLTTGTPESVDVRLRFAGDHLRPGGLLALAAEVPLDAPRPQDAVRAEVLSGDAFRNDVRTRFGLLRLGCAPLAISRTSLDMCVAEPQGADRPPHFVALRAGRPVTSGCWFFERAGDRRERA
ncbi:hypothetical protein [Azospirillum sp.]|uniref:hypothetical protein n=1 Tax=Azospirillum sp. TaxID=34012 RepID=UPI003D720A47